MSLVAYAEQAQYADVRVLQLFIDQTDRRTLAVNSQQKKTNEGIKFVKRSAVFMLLNVGIKVLKNAK